MSLLGLSEPETERMVEAANAFPKAKVHKGTLRAAQTRRNATGPGSMQKRYVNVAMGSSEEGELDDIVAELKKQGYEASKAPGPPAHLHDRRDVWQVDADAAEHGVGV